MQNSKQKPSAQEKQAVAMEQIREFFSKKDFKENLSLIKDVTLNSPVCDNRERRSQLLLMFNLIQKLNKTF